MYFEGQDKFRGNSIHGGIRTFNGDGGSNVFCILEDAVTLLDGDN